MAARSAEREDGTSRETRWAAGLLLSIAPVPAGFLGLPGAAADATSVTLGVLASVLLAAGGLLQSARPELGQRLAVAGLLAGAAPVLPFLAAGPAPALAGVATAAIVAFIILRPSWSWTGEEGRGSARRRRRHRARGAAWGALAVAVLAAFITDRPTGGVAATVIGSVLVAAAATSLWAWTAVRSGSWAVRSRMSLLAAIAGPAIVLAARDTEWIAVCGVLAATGLLAVCPSRDPRRHVGPWWEPLTVHPARILVSTFLMLGVIGTALLMLPGMGSDRRLDLGEAAFTAVSATCVTGLIVLDTPVDLSGLGQATVLALIQLGGLGIMTVSTMVLHAMGRRLSVRQERLLAELHAGPDPDLLATLRRVLQVTFTVEAAGAVLLIALFLAAGDSPAAAVWRGCFTAVSAFCNAGFALQSDSLMGYADQPLVLHVVATMILLGGVSPAIVIALLTGRRRALQDPAVRIVVTTNLVLLLVGFVAFLGFEWSRTLAGTGAMDRVHGAWFQSVTLRTAGFNSVDLGQCAPETLFVSMLLMFVGGSPGGTAGGIKTTVVAILVLTAWTSITGRREIVVAGRAIPHGAVHRSIAVVTAGAVVWVVIVLALLITQPLPPRDLVFEATSALGTVGLSTGITGELDGVGRVVIIVAMFLGRVGPLSLFALLGADRDRSAARHPEAHVVLT